MTLNWFFSLYSIRKDGAEFGTRFATTFEVLKQQQNIYRNSKLHK